MTESEAIKVIINNRPTSGYVILNEALEMAINSLEKQVPKKIVRYDVCPVCNNNQSTTWYYVGSSYCEFCGQKLDWK